jgi:DNA-binding beta-propeller fold protein YncE
MLAAFLVLLLCAGLTVQASAAGDSAYFAYEGVLGDDPGPSAPSYTLGNPVGLAKDSDGNYFVADIAGGRVLKLNSNYQQTDEISGIDMPLFVYVDNDDNILINELGTHSILKYDSDLQFVTQWGGPGDGDGEFNIPRSIVQDSHGNYYVSDELNHRIQKFDIDGTFLAAYGEWGSSNGQFKVQQGLSIDAQDRLYVADTYNSRIQVFQTYPSWQFAKKFGTQGIYNPANIFSFQSNIFNHPRGVYVEKSTGRVAVTDSGNNRVMVYNNYNSNFSFYQSQNGALGMSLPTHAILENNYVTALDSHSRIIKFGSILNNTMLYSSYGTSRTSSSQFSNPQSVAVDPTNGEVYVSDSFNHRIQRFDENGDLLQSYGGNGGPNGSGSILGRFLYPKQVTVGIYGTLVVADFGNGRVVAKPANSSAFVLATPIGGVTLPWGVATDDTVGRVYVSDWSSHSIKVFQNGVLVRSWGGSGTANGRFNNPCDLLIAPYGSEETALYVADSGNNRVQIFTLTGSYLGQLGQPNIDPLQYYDNAKADGAMLLPYGVAATADGKIVVADTSHKCMRVYDTSGTLLETFGEMSISEGDYFSPMGIAVNQQTGRLYVTDGVLERVQYYDRIDATAQTAQNMTVATPTDADEADTVDEATGDEATGD